MDKVARRQFSRLMAAGTSVLTALLTLPFLGRSQGQPAPIHFSHRPIAFVLNNGAYSCESDQ
jgi:hypothetical protein